MTPQDGSAAVIDASEAAPAEMQEQLSKLIAGHRITQAIACVARLAIPDALAGGPRTAAELAADCGAHERSLHRLLRAVTGIGVVRQMAPGTFALTPMGQLLRSDSPRSMRALAIMLGSEWQWRSWRAIDHSVTTGEPAFEHVHGAPLFEWLAANPDEAAIFDAAMDANAANLHAVVAEVYDFSGAETIVDVGGGRGRLLRAIVDRAPGAGGVLFDVPRVIEQAREDGFADSRIELVAGDFFVAVPPGDVYVLSFILHDWRDEQAVAILRSIRAAIPPHGRVVLSEAVVPEGDAESVAKWRDLEMLLVPGGLERTEAEYRALLGAAGFELTRVVPTDGVISVIEGRPHG